MTDSRSHHGMCKHYFLQFSFSEKLLLPSTSTHSNARDSSVGGSIGCPVYRFQVLGSAFPLRPIYPFIPPRWVNWFKNRLRRVKHGLVHRLPKATVRTKCAFKYPPRHSAEVECVAHSKKDWVRSFSSWSLLLFRSMLHKILQMPSRITKYLSVLEQHLLTSA